MARPKDASPGQIGVLSGRPLAVVLLSWSLLKVLLRHLTRRKPGLERFHDNYGSDRLSAIEKAERRLMVRFSRCIACGRCDIGEAERIASSGGSYPGLMQWVLASTRSMPDFDAAVHGLALVPEAVLHRKVQACPVGLPFPELARFIHAKAQQDAGQNALKSLVATEPAGAAPTRACCSR